MASTEGVGPRPQNPRGKGASAAGAAGTAGAGASAGGTSNPSPAASQSSSSTTDSKWKGRIVKRFKLVDELGEGAMGRVFVAEDTVLKRHVALKLLPARFRDGRPNHRTERLIREARSVASLEHPNTLSIFEIDQSGGVHYIAMELAEGGDLEKLVQFSGPMEIERACQLGAEAAEALSHAHARGIIHRDVKPANLLLTRSGRCKVCDFGLALFDDTPDGEGRFRCVGTPNFIAPEIAQGKGATAASDVYSLGCTLFFLLTGRAPFSGPNARDVMKQHINQPLPDLRKWRQDVPEKLAAAIEKACAKDPAQRWDSAERLAKVLRTFTIPTGTSSSALGLPPVEPAGSGHGSGAHGSHGYDSQGMAGAGALPPISAAQLAAILPPPPTEAEKARAALSAPLVWAGVGTVAAALLIGLGVWLSRSGSPSSSNPASNAAPTPPAPPAIAAAPAPPSAKRQAAAPPAAAPTPTPGEATRVATPPTPVSNVVAPKKSPASAPALIAGAEALTNGSMEASGADGGLTAWSFPERYKPQVKIVSEDGNRFLRLTNDEISHTVFVGQTIAVEPGWKAVTISARVRASNFALGKTVANDARVAFNFRDENGEHIGKWPTVPRVQQDTPWVTRTATADVPAGAKSLYVQCTIFYATGTVDFDDVSVVPQIAK